MRPLRLELEGFTAFRDPQVVDFADADLFALVGPTGSGKSSVIDALCFVLYGTVPRYDDKRLVAPVISQGRNEARVRLDFSVGDATYTAVRVVRRTKTGATTKEARLEDANADVIAGDADELSAAVVELIGLTYDHFTKCVVLPQGEFARFLHDKPKDRQDLLVELLNLGLYADVARSARRVADTAKAEAEVLEAQLGELAQANDAALEQTRARVAAIVEVQEAIAAADMHLQDVKAEMADVTRGADDVGERIRRLADIAIPVGTDSLAADLESADSTLAQAQRSVESAEAVHAEAVESAQAAADGRRALDERLAAFERRKRLVAELDKTRPQADATARAAVEASDAERLATAGLDAAQAGLEAVRNEHRAHALAAELEPGDECPVCLQTVAAPPVLAAAGDLAQARAATSEAAGAHETAARGRRAAADVAAKHAAAMQSLEGEIGDIDARLADGPDSAAAQRCAQEIDAIVARASTASAHLKTARAARKAAEKTRAALEDRLTASREDFDNARDRVGALDPPAAQRRNIAEDWAALAQWASARLPDENAAQEKARNRVAELDQARSRIDAGVAQTCKRSGIDVDGTTPREACAEAQANAIADVARLEEAIDRARRLRTAHEDANERRNVGAALGRLLDARNFEAWVLDEVLELLIADASERLETLSSGRYAFALDEKTPPNFAVVDHRNADELRPARTLSGGETFLASLALALALAERLTDLAAQSTARLDAIFLDEGFGTLDPETLDIVATAVEELGARGRMVGIVTHVRDLAERVAVRYEVQRGARSSSIERIDL